MTGHRFRPAAAGLLASFLLSVLLLLLLALGLYRFCLPERAVNAGITVIYGISCLAGGIAAGKTGKKRRFLWGLLCGILYFVILTAASFFLGSCAGLSASSLLPPFLICAGCGMLGGMAS